MKEAISVIRELEEGVQSNRELIELAEAEGQDDMVLEAKNELLVLYELAKHHEIECLFSGEADQNDCFLEVHAGAGGTESHDWADMLLRMYQRWCDAHKFKVEIIDKFIGEEAGIKSATLKVSGKNVYGWLKTESGVHRLVRISPFNAAGKPPH